MKFTMRLSIYEEPALQNRTKNEQRTY